MKLPAKIRIKERVGLYIPFVCTCRECKRVKLWWVDAWRTAI